MPTNHPRRTHRSPSSVPALIGLTLFVAVGLPACGGDRDRPVMEAPACQGDDCGAPSEQVAPLVETGCEDGEERSCKVELPTLNGQENCFVGIQICVEGTWTECGAAS